jgi:hypothetical protein
MDAHGLVLQVRDLLSARVNVKGATFRIGHSRRVSASALEPAGPGGIGDGDTEEAQGRGR